MRIRFFGGDGGAEYDAFISYSHEQDRPLAAALQRGLERFMRRWYRPRAMSVFRDETNLSASPELWPEIERRLARSHWFILIASPTSAASLWVQREVAWWLEHRGPSKLIIALADGTIAWSQAAGDFDWQRTDALPADALRGTFASEPLWVELRTLRQAMPAGETRHVPIPLATLALVASPIVGKDPAELLGENVRYTRRTRRLIGSVIAVLTALLLLVSGASIYAVNQRDKAITQARIATARLLAADSGSLLRTNLGMAQLLAVQAYHMDVDPQTTAALFAAVTASPSLVRYLPAGGTVTALAASANGQAAVAGTGNGQVQEWRLGGAWASGAAASAAVTVARLPTAVQQVAASRDGSVIVAAAGHQVVVWAAGHGTGPLALPHAYLTASLTVSPDGRYVAVASQAPSVASHQTNGLTDVTLLDRKTGAIRHTSAVVSPFAMGMPDDSTLVLASQGGPWERLSVSALAVMLGPSNVTTGVHGTAYALSPGGGFFGFTNGGGTVPLWSTNRADPVINTPPDLLSISHGAAPQSLAISPDGSRVAVGDGGTIYMYASGKGVPPQAGQHALSGSGNTPFIQFAGGDDRLVSASGNSIALWDLRQFSRIGSQEPIAVTWACEGCGAPSIHPSPNGRYAAIFGGNPGRTVIHGLGDSPAQKIIQGAGIVAGTYPVGWSTGGDDVYVVASGLLDAVPVNGGRITQQRSVRDARFEVLSFSAARQELIEDDETDVRVISLADGQTERAIGVPGHGHGIAFVTNADDTYLAVQFQAGRSIASQAAAMDLRTGQVRTVGSGDVAQVAFSGGHLLVQRKNGDVEVWDEAGSVRQAVIHQDLSYQPNGASVAAAPALAGSLLVQERSNGGLVITDITSGAVIGSLPRSSQLRTGLAVSPRGDRLIAVTEAPPEPPTALGQLAQWSFDSGSWIEAACRAAGQSLTDAEIRGFTGAAGPGFLACSHR
jgi:WD40 repeat protein